MTISSGKRRSTLISCAGNEDRIPTKIGHVEDPGRGWETLAFLRSCRRVSVLSIPQSHIFCALSFPVGIF
jgi:hypothetical protein